MKGKFISELEPGLRFSASIFVIREVALRKASNGNEYLTCTLSDRSGSSQAKMWNATTEICQQAYASRLVRVSGEVQAGEYAGSIIFKSFEPVDIPDDLSNFLPNLPENHEKQQAAFHSMIATVEQKHLRTLLDKVFALDGDIWQPFCGGVAAANFHHAYRGGLLDHTIEVAQLCEAICNVMPSLRRDFLVTCALLHDIGKLEEMDHGLTCGEYSAAGNLIGHIVLGMQSVSAACDAISDFPADLKMGVMHMLLSHHGTAEFGSVKTPMCAEAQVLATNDQLSARLDQCRTATASAIEGKNSTVVRGWNSKFLHVGDFGMELKHGEMPIATTLI